jgi:hypothetical protein
MSILEKGKREKTFLTKSDWSADPPGEEKEGFSHSWEPTDDQIS